MYHDWESLKDSVPHKVSFRKYTICTLSGQRPTHAYFQSGMPAGRRWGACKFWCLLEHIGKFLVHIQSLGSTFVSMYGFWNIKYLKPFESTEDVVMRCSSLLRQIQVPQCWSFVCMHFRLWFCTWCFRCSFCWRSLEEVLRASFDCPHPCIDGKECLMAINDWLEQEEWGFRRVFVTGMMRLLVQTDTLVSSSCDYEL